MTTAADEHPTTTPTDDQPVEDRGSNRSQRPSSAAFRAFIADGWEERESPLPERLASAATAATARAALSLDLPGERLVLPGGDLRVRSNDTDYIFRAHSAFAHLTGWGSATEPDSVLVLHPAEAGEDGSTAGHEAVLYFRPRAGKDTEEFYADARYGELWVGERPSLEEVAAATGLRTAHIDTLRDDLAKDAGVGQVQVRLVRGADQAVTELVDQVRAQAGLTGTETVDAELTERLSELRLVKVSWEVGELRAAVAATARGFEDVVRSFPRASGHARGERIVEGAFAARARLDGNGIGYDTIAAAGNHANTLHWIHNDGEVRAGDLVLIDAGVEVDSLYTADVTRTLPVDGTFTEPQRRVYRAVLDAADAAFAVAGRVNEDGSRVRFRDVHAAAMEVVAARLAEWGMLPVDAASSLEPEGQYHRRWMVHGTSHHLGLDVHDCAQARREMYLDAELVPGMVFTIEPGLYLRADDLKVPEDMRGIGVRIEDDVLVTETGVENLSAALPRTPEAIEEWMAALRG
ncbi:aminopeptidase P family protein [Georgenia sp. Z1344]|uniref:aminopeptidase P family protein n=1 Tax=Georgenia sp. Z1344 TaxID=3416706 RepID=UPI003CF53940